MRMYACVSVCLCACVYNIEVEKVRHTIIMCVCINSFVRNVKSKTYVACVFVPLREMET